MRQTQIKLKTLYISLKGFFSLPLLIQCCCKALKCIKWYRPHYCPSNIACNGGEGEANRTDCVRAILHLLHTCFNSFIQDFSSRLLGFLNFSLYFSFAFVLTSGWQRLTMSAVKTLRCLFLFLTVCTQLENCTSRKFY